MNTLNSDDYFSSLVSAARVRADKAMRKFPQPNYVLNKVAEESGEVIKAVIHYTEGREEWSNVEGEIIDNLAMLIRLVTEGDQVIGFSPPSAAHDTGLQLPSNSKSAIDYKGIVERISEIVHGKVTDIDLLSVTVRSMAEKLRGNHPALPDGWVIVPIEPTESMIIDGFESEPDESFSRQEDWKAYEAMSGCEQAAHRARLCWAAMIAAAPQHKGE